MNIIIEKIDPAMQEEIIVKCHDEEAEWVERIRSVNVNTEGLLGELDGKRYRLHLDKVFYFEVVDRKSFIYYNDKTFESKLKLYEFENYCRGTSLFRASKSIVLNADKINHIMPSFSGRLVAVLENGEKVIVSRQYVADLKKMLGV